MRQPKQLAETAPPLRQTEGEGKGLAAEDSSRGLGAGAGAGSSMMGTMQTQQPSRLSGAGGQPSQLSNLLPSNNWGHQEQQRQQARLSGASGGGGVSAAALPLPPRPMQPHAAAAPLLSSMQPLLKRQGSGASDLGRPLMAQAGAAAGSRPSLGAPGLPGLPKRTDSLGSNASLGSQGSAGHGAGLGGLSGLPGPGPRRTSNNSGRLPADDAILSSVILDSFKPPDAGKGAPGLTAAEEESLLRELGLPPGVVKNPGGRRPSENNGGAALPPLAPGGGLGARGGVPPPLAPIRMPGSGTGQAGSRGRY